MTPQPPPPPPAAPVQKKTSGLAIAALVLSLVGLCIPCIPSLVGLILGIVALGKLKDATQKGQGLAITAIVISGLWLPVTGMAAIAIPNFIRFQARSKQSECKSNLKAVYVAERSYYLERDEYSEDVQTIGFQPEARRRYAYFLSAEGPFLSEEPNAGERGFHGYLPDLTEVSPADVPPEVAEALGVRGRCPECDFTAACVGQIDSDETLDVWVISSADLGPDGQPGQPYNLVNDVDE